ncbi:N-6 DNA methylase [Nocardia cerradoensis]|uniref:Putative type I restriction enzymeP M protein n=1 Tax=Nocardia cerradoensis TaxID=85688 RepID=A0A231H5L7_9NOCA|nr:N-6 DNA methylase [Nocardia cerradoensis]NKY44281.1 N-6 DNA methylase [Nocardia cerradoensis]OXR44006.1 putative type I restriction enzymeP M protein [Nocardia cerradoensis]
MPKPVSKVSAAEISRLAGVTRATVSNWRRRHDDFPDPIAGNETRPLFDLHAVRKWLAEHNIEAAQSPDAELRTLVRSRATPDAITRVMQTLRREGDEWSAPGADDPELAAEIASALQLAETADGIRTALDILSERAMDDAASTGVYVTPVAVASTMAALTRSATTPNVHSVFDPACGSGSLLLAAAHEGARELYGQDVVPVQAERARLLIEAETTVEPEVRAGDSLTSDAFSGVRVDAVLCNPPYGLRDWGSGELAFDTRWDYGLPPRGEPELAWVQHAIAHLRPGGIAVLLLPPSVATRAAGRKIRSNLVRTGALRAVIGLAPGVAQPRHVGLQIWVVRRPEPDVAVPDSMLFIDTTGVAVRTDGDRADRDTVVEMWRTFDSEKPDSAAESGISAVVRLVDLLDDEVDLTPARYVRSALDSSAISEQVATSLDELSRAASELDTAVTTVPAWSESTGKSWRFVTVAHLATHGQLQWFRAAPQGTESPVGDRRRVLTALDVATGNRASGTVDMVPADPVEVHEGDVLMPAVRGDRRGGRSARVATSEDAGAVLGPHVHALRVDRDRLDPWFLAGFLTGAENISATRTSTVRFDASRLRIPVLSLDEQRRYGTLFRQLFLLRSAARRASDAAEEAAELITTGLTAAALEPGTGLGQGRDL